jgi:AcrR family transcriptional regulator
MPRRAQPARRRLLEDTAIRLFCERGYCAVGLREIAEEAGVSLGNIYNHFERKEPLFERIVDRLYQDFLADTEPLARFVATAHLPEDSAALGHAVKSMVERHREYLTLVYVDIAEFGGHHVRAHYQELASRFRAALAPALHDRSLLANWVDPGVAFALLYLQFASHFVMERLMGARHHLGLDDNQAIETITRLFLLGITPRPEPTV